jgi:hypothetical protein
MKIQTCLRCQAQWCSRTDVPYRCGKCKTPYWDKPIKNAAMPAPKPVASPVKGIPSLPAGVSLGMPAAPPPMADIRMCPYKEFDPELGEWFACGRPVHDYKVKHTRGRRI